MWGYFCGGITKIPPHTLSVTAIPKDPFLIRNPAKFFSYIMLINNEKIVDLRFQIHRSIE